MKALLFTIFKNISLHLRGTGLGKLPYAMTIYKRLIARTSPKFVKIDSLTYYLDGKDSLGLSVFGFNDETQVRLIKKTIKKNWNVIDVGAHIGYYSMQYAKLVGNKGRVFSFEPSKESYLLLTKNAKENNLKNIIVENYAVSDVHKKIKFFISDDSQTNKIANKYTTGDSFYVQSIRLDDYFKDFKKTIHFVKIDVEGAEFSVLKGMKGILKKNKKIKLLIEFCPEHLNEFSVDPEDMLSFLENLGFSFYDVSDKNKNIKSISKKKLLQNYQSGITNIFCTRS